MKTNVLMATVTLILILTNMLGLTFNLTSTAAAHSTAINVPDDYATIQESIDAANPGDTIIIASGIYYEHINISKSHLTLLGENPSSTIIDGDGTGPIIYLLANNTNIMGVTVRDSGEEEPGLYIKCACYNMIANNIFYECKIGIKIEGTMPNNSWSNKIIGNTVIDDDIGIFLIKFAVNNTVIGNTVKNSEEGIHLTAYSSSNTINGNVVTDNEYGIYLSLSKGNTIYGNVLTQNGYGVYLYGVLSTQNTIKHNLIANNEYGIEAEYPSNNNIVYLNNFIQNTNQVHLYDPTSTLTFIWDNGAEGNYWSDYSGDDLDGDGIGETPHVINAKNRDNYPFVKMWGWDAVKPSVTIISPRNDSQIESSTVLVSWSGSDDNSGVDHYEIQLDDNSWINVGKSVSHTFTELEDGSHTIKTKVIDRAGNFNIASARFGTKTDSIGLPIYIKGAILLAIGIVIAAGIAIYFLRIKEKA